MTETDYEFVNGAADRFRREMEQEAEERHHEVMQEKPRMTNMEAFQAADESVGQMKKDNNVFATLNKIDVSNHTEKKGQFTYLSWAWAVSELLKNFPEATWDIKRFDGLPYLKADTGHYVEVEVNVNGIKRTQVHPVLDNFNRPIEKPNSFQVNTSIQRCLVKAIGLHGLGLYIYAGEDLPETIKEEHVVKKKYHDLLKKKHGKDIPEGVIFHAKRMSTVDLRQAIKSIEEE